MLDALSGIVLETIVVASVILLSTIVVLGPVERLGELTEVFIDLIVLEVVVNLVVGYGVRMEVTDVLWI